MINTLLEHVPIKMEVQDIDEPNGIPVNPRHEDGVAKDDENIDETDEDVDADGSEDDEDEEDIDEDDEEDEEESDIETDALEIEKEATMLISSDEEAELEAQRIRFPDITVAKKLRRDSNMSSGSSTRSSQTSNLSSQPHITYEIVKQKDCTTEETNNKQRISPRLKHMGNKSLESCNKENNNKNKILLKQKTENKNLENHKSLENGKTKPEETHKRLEHHKTADIHKNSENTRKKENLLKSPEHKSRRGSNNSTCSVASTVASNSAETESCGNIYVFNLEQKLVFNCEFCDLKYGDLDNFGLHLHEAHKLFNFDEDPEKENAPRNLGKTNRQSNSAPKNCVNVKKEPLQYVDLKAEPPVALPPSALAEPLDSCGNVFMLNHRKLFLVCGYCESKYANLELFEKHLRQQHRIFEGCHNEVNVVPKVEVKEEVFVISEVADKPDITIPQAMVAIPAEIPLDISITPENEHESIAALEDKVIPEVTGGKETAVLAKPTGVKQTFALEKIAAEKIATAQDKQIEHFVEVGKEQNSSADNTEESSKEIRVDDTALYKENLKNDPKEKSVIRKTRNKRQSSPDKQLESPNKRTKRKTRNNGQGEQESLAVNEADKSSATNLKADPVVENDTLQNATAEVENQQKACKSTKWLETEKAAPLKKTPTRQWNKTKGFEQKIAFKATEKVTDTEEISFKLATHNQEPAEPEKKTSAKSTKSKETRKTIDHEKAPYFKSTEAKKARKSADADKTREVRKTTDSEKPTLLVLTESRETRKKKESIKTTASASTEPKESRKTRDPEKTISLRKSETRETRTSTKRAATDNPALEIVEPKKQTPSKTISNKSVISSETKNHQDDEKSETVNSKLRCSVCSKEFAKKKSLIWHERTHQTGSNKRYGCGICGKDFLVENERKSHMLARHNVDTLSECNLCYRAFSSKSGLERHNEKSHAVRLFKCGECLRTYSSESSLKTHIYIYHSASKKAPGKNKRNSAQKLNLSPTIQKELSLSDDSMQETEALLENNVKTDKTGIKTQEVISGDLQNVIEETTTESAAVILALDDDINAKPIDIIDKQLSSVEFAKLAESADTFAVIPPSNNTEQTIFVADLNGQKNNNEMVLEMPSENAEDTTKSSKSTTKAYGGDGTEEDDPTADPVSDIIEQLQNELAESSTESTTSTTNNVVTYTINAMPNKEETQKSVVLDAQLNVLDKTEDVKPTFLKIVKHFVCDICSKTYYKHSRLIEHKRLHTGEKPFGCDECGKQFRVRNRLNEHKQRHSKEKKFKCEICQLPLCTRQDYNLHMRHHTNDRRHQCSVCPKAFVRSSDLKIHERIHTGEKPYVCDICHKCFRANQNLSVHKKSHMGDISKTFKCEFCEKKFMRKIDRKVHMRTHTGEKPYKCEICQRGYSSRVNVRAHIDRDHIKGSQEEKKKPGPKPRSLREELERQKKLIEELQNQLLQQIKTDEKIILSDEEIQGEHILPDSPVKVSSPIATPTTTAENDPVQSAYKLLSKLKASSSTTTTSKSLTVIPSPPPLEEPPSSPLTANNKKDTSTTLLPLTITQKLEQASPAMSSGSATTSCATTPSPPLPQPAAAAKTTATKVVSQKTSLGIQQVSVTVSMQVENVSANSNTAEKDNSQILTTSPGGGTSVKKERKITSYFTVLDQKSKV